MSKQRQYKNPYTILEKVKKGEIATHYRNEEGGLFGKLNFYKKPDLVKPTLHYIDEIRLREMMQDYIVSGSASKKIAETLSTLPKDVINDKKLDTSKFAKNVRELNDSFPKHILYDIFKMYYNRMDKLEFSERTDKNFTKYKFLEKANNPVGKIMSESSHLKSSIFARNTLMYFLMQLAKLEYIDPDASQDLKSCLNGDSSEFDQDNIEKLLNKMFDDSKGQYEKEMQEAQDICKNIDDNIDPEVQEQIYKNPDKSSSLSAGKMDSDFIKKLSRQIESIKLSMSSLKNSLKKILDKSMSYFSAKSVPIFEDLFNAQDISGLNEYELLHPKLRKIFAEDVQVKENKYFGKINVYIDVSGSMDDSCGSRNQDGKEVSRLEFAKAMVMKLKEMNILNEIYPFNTRVKTNLKTDSISIATLDSDGGTHINSAVEHIVRNGQNAIIITDAEDSCNIYDERVFFIGLKGARFSHFNGETLKKYSEAQQIIIFDGEKIFNVDEKGVLKK